MFWRMAGLSTASPVETIMDKENFTLEELLDEDEIIQECKALNTRLINFLRDRARIEQLLHYIIEEAPEDAEKRQSFKFPFIACEIFTCEVDVILKALVEDEELMNYLFSFLEPEHPHSTLLAGYFSKVVVCLLLRKTVPLMNYIQAHQDIIRKLVDLIGITSIMEVLIRLIGADEHLYTSYTDSMQWLENTDVLEMIVDKFSSSDCPEVHTNAAETLCAITRYAPPALAAKISSPSFVGRLFCHALEESRPKSVLVNSLSVCISLLDPKRLTFGTYHMYGRQLNPGSTISANPETVEGMLGCIGDLLKLLEISSEENLLPTTYGKLHPPLGKHRLKIIEFVSVLVTVSSEAVEKELICLGAVNRILDLFFEYPYNNFLHHHVEHIITSCLESKNASFVEHLLKDCDLVGKILEVEKNSMLVAVPNKPTVPADGKLPPRIGNIGHITRISNRLVQLGNNNSDIQTYLQGNNDWVDWHANVLVQRNAVENFHQWACGRPTALQDRTRDSDDEDYQDRDYDVAALANNLSQAFRYGIYGTDDIEEAHGSLDRDDEDVYFDDESAEVVISSLRLGDDQENGSLFTNSNWFAFEDERVVNERSADSIPSSSPNNNAGGTLAANSGGGDDDEVVIGDGEEDEELTDTATSQVVESKISSEDPVVSNLSKESSSSDQIIVGEKESAKPPESEWVEWRETSDVAGASSDGSGPPSVLPNGEVQQVESKKDGDQNAPAANPNASSPADDATGGSTAAEELTDKFIISPKSESGDENPSSNTSSTNNKPVETEEGSSGAADQGEKVEVGK
ncbi:hypothetical protein NMG60_11015182 [Bertholletia excelsa]